MEQKLQNLLYSLPARTAWIVVGSCAAFWLICLTGVLIPPVSTPPSMTLVWFYTMLMLVFASGLAAIGAAAVLVLKRGGLRAGPADAVTAPATAADADPGPGSPSAPASGKAPPEYAPAKPDDAGPDQLAGLGRMLDDPGNEGERSGSRPAAPSAAESPAAAAPEAAAPEAAFSAPRPARTRKGTQRKRRKGRR